MGAAIQILLLEDKFDDARIIQDVLRQSGLEFDCVQVKSESDYLNALSSDIDLILADYSLSNFNALQALQLLKTRIQLDIPFIIVSGAISNELAVECMKHGAADYLLKDRLTRLGHAVRQALHEKKLCNQTRLLEQAEREQRALALALAETVRVVSTTLDLDTVLNTILDSVGRVVPHDASNIILVEERSLDVSYLRGYDKTDRQALFDHTYTLDDSMFRAMLETGTTRLEKNGQSESDQDLVSEIPWIKSRLMAPIRSRDETIGFLVLDSASPQAFTTTHAEWLSTFASEAAVAINNARLYRQVRRHADELEVLVDERTFELVLAKQRVEAVLNSTSDAIILLRDNLQLDQANPAFHQMFGYDTPQVPDLTIAHLCDQNSFEKWINAIELMRKDAVPRRFDIIAMRQDGSLFEAEAALSLVKEADISLIVCSLRDISQRKLIEIELQNAVAYERELTELKSRFIAIVSHEFRNPLASIQMSASTLEYHFEKLNIERRSYHYENIAFQIDQMTELLEDVLTIESVASGKGKLTLTPTDLTLLCQEVVDGFKNLSSVDRQIIYTHEGPQLSDVLLDQRRIRQLVTNLVSNAIKYSSDQGKVHVGLHSDHKDIRLVVRDEGIGIPEQDQEYLFQAFNRAGNIGEIPGTGLGLVIVKNIAEMHGGTIDFVSTVGLGTTFTVTLPVAIESSG